jgi:hypothetical protein
MTYLPARAISALHLRHAIGLFELDGMTILLQVEDG